MSKEHAGRHRPTIDRVSMRVVGTMDENGWVRDMDARREGYNYRPIHTPLTEAQIAHWNATGKRGAA